MSNRAGFALATMAIIPTAAVACDCRGIQPACAYLESDAIFIGRVAFTNDDGSGRFTQATLVRFDLEEGFKGIPPGERDVWVDPGSFTSCYRNYELGRRYLIFGKRRATAMTIGRGKNRNRKHAPPGFDPLHPPPVYYSPECSGSRLIDGDPRFAEDLSMLRTYRSGARPPRVLGHVYLYPFRGWPVLSGPMLPHARVTMVGGGGNLEAFTDETGNFTVADAPAGYYNAWAELLPYRVDGQFILHIPETGCGYVDVQMATTTTLVGLVIDARGRPVPNVPVAAHLKNVPEAQQNPYGLAATTDASGQFTIRGLPEAEFHLSAGSAFPRTDVPYRRTYHPKAPSRHSATVFHLKPGEHPAPIVLILDAPLSQDTIEVRVTRPDGSPARATWVHAFDPGRVIAESAKTDAEGVARLACLRGLTYGIGAQSAAGLPVQGFSPPWSLTPATCSARTRLTLTVE